MVSPHLVWAAVALQSVVQAPALGSPRASSQPQLAKHPEHHPGLIALSREQPAHKDQKALSVRPVLVQTIQPRAGTRTYKLNQKKRRNQPFSPEQRLLCLSPCSSHQLPGCRLQQDQGSRPLSLASSSNSSQQRPLEHSNNNSNM